MAEAIGLGASLLGIAAFGASIVTTLRTFAASYLSAESKISALAADVALTASILTSLGTLVNEYEAELGLKVDNFLAAKEACERCFETLKKALKEAKTVVVKDTIDKKESQRAREKGRERNTNAWGKLMFALGGEENMGNLVTSLETAKSNLQLLLDSMNLLVLKNLNKKHLLQDDQAEDLRLLVYHIPMLLKSLQHAKMISWPSKTKPTELATEIRSVNLTTLPNAGQALPVPETMEEANVQPVYLTLLRNVGQALPVPETMEDANVQPVNLTTIPNVGQVLPVSETIEDANGQPFSWSTTSPSQDSYHENLSARSRDVYDGNLSARRRLAARERGFVINEELVFPEPSRVPRRTEAKYETEKTYRVDLPVALHVSESESLPDTSSHYEGWLLWEPVNDVATTVVRFCGLKLEIDNSKGTQKEGYRVRPFSRDREMLKRHVENFERGSQGRETRSRVAEILAELQEAANLEIEELVRRRNNSATESFGWKIAALVDIARERAGKAWRQRSAKRARTAQWLIVLQGGLADSEANAVDLPSLWSNPWMLTRPMVERGPPRAPSRGPPRGPGFEMRRAPLRERLRYDALRYRERDSAPIRFGERDSVAVTFGARGSAPVIINGGFRSDIPYDENEISGSVGGLDSDSKLGRRLGRPSSSRRRGYDSSHDNDNVINRLLGSERSGQHIRRGTRVKDRSPSPTTEPDRTFEREAEDDDLLPQDDAERLMDEYLATFTFDSHKES